MREWRGLNRKYSGMSAFKGDNPNASPPLFFIGILFFVIFAVKSCERRKSCLKTAMFSISLSISRTLPSSFTSFTGPTGSPVLLSPGGIVRASRGWSASRWCAEHWPANWFLHYTRLSSPSPFSLAPSFLLSLCLPLRVSPLSPSLFLLSLLLHTRRASAHISFFPLYVSACPFYLASPHPYQIRQSSPLRNDRSPRVRDSRALKFCIP